MIIYQILLTFILFSTIYPLVFWLTPLQPPQYPFHKYHLRITNFSSGIAVIALLFMPISLESKWMLVIWKASLFGVSIYYWKKPQVNYWAVTVPFVLGLFTLSRIMSEYFLGPPQMYIIAVLSGFIFCSIFFINHLCVWNMIHKEKSFDLIKRVSVIYSIMLMLRLGWTGYVFLVRNVCPHTSYTDCFGCLIVKQGYWLPFIGVLLVAVFPLIAVTFFRRHLGTNTYDWALGFMFPVLLATIAGEVCLKVVWFKYGIPL